MNISPDPQEKKCYNKEQFHQKQLENIGKLTACVAHDLHNLFTVMLANIELLEGKVTKKDNNTLQTLQSSVLRASELTDGLLALIQYKPSLIKPIDPKAPLEQLCQLLSESLHCSFSFTIQQSNPVKKILISKASLGQILLNLVINASQATPAEGKVVVCAQFKKKYFVLKVSDTGSGMQEEIKDKIFTPFFSTKESSGLGLAIVQSLVEQASGQITVTSTVKGTTFTIHLPIAIL